MTRTYLNRGAVSFGSSKQLTGLSVTAGDLIVVIGGCLNDTAVVDLAIASTNMGTLTWTEITANTTSGASRITTSIFYAVVQSTTASGTLTISGGDGNGHMWLEASTFNGQDATPDGGKGTVADATIANPETETITMDATPVAGDISYGGFTGKTVSTGVYAAGSSFTEIAEANQGSAMAYQTQERTGSTSTACSWVCSGPSMGVGAVLNIKAAASNTFLKKQYWHQTGGINLGQG